MAAIFDDIIITYAGQTHTVKPTFRLINRIEQSEVGGGLGISLASMVSRSSHGEPPITEIVRILAMLLRDSGIKVSDDDMYVEVMQSSDIRSIIAMVTSAFFPVVRPAATESAQDKTGKKK